MKQHEREFFIYRVRSGVIISGDIEIRPPTIRNKAIATERYISAYNEALADDMMTEDEINEWMISNGLWEPEQEKKLKQAEKDIEKLKIEIFNNHANDDMVERIRKYLRAAEKFRDKQLAEKQEFIPNTVEGIARSEELISLLTQTTYINNTLVDFDDNPSLIHKITHIYYQEMLSEGQVRELARTNPWAGLWAIKDSVGIKLFDMKDGDELTPNQHALLMWSQTYDNIQESMDCPVDYVIKDDDMLDGWFLTQEKKREKQKSEKDFDEGTKSEKIKNAGEVFVMSKGKKDDERISRMNSAHGNAIKKQRFNLLNKKGSVKQSDFADEKLKLQTMSNQQFKDAVKRR